MKIEKLHEVSFSGDETITTAALSKSNEIILLTNTGNVARFDMDTKEGKHLFSIKSSFSYSDGGFDAEAKSSIYTLDEIVVVVNDFKRHGFVHYPGKYHALHLWRGEYHADISCYPIALFKNSQNIPHIIYGYDWNHVQIMNLDTRQVLTAAKSLIRENAENDHIEFYKKYSEENKLAWPSPYDYFYGKLHMSPDNQHFLSAGWAWGSCDAYHIYNLDQFIQSNRISDISLGAWEHENRAVCWINDHTIAIGYNAVVEGDEEADKNNPFEIHLYHFSNGQAEWKEKIKIAGDLDIVNGEMQFYPELNSIIAYSKKNGIAAIGFDGTIHYQDQTSNVTHFYKNERLFLTVRENTVSIHALTV